MSPSDYAPTTEFTVSKFNLGWEKDRLHIFTLTHLFYNNLKFCT